ncbi:long-chain acyl-CoA synthetase/feruloyl-CoA synthase [Halopseudomonas xinjiangensis]|uniref:Long-chain acyl-CoA synthetase/feruloyl-CoA synthase n=1 Tax=Halopseudomonas xinjiangensis TaxID=487184 RepID=A0A1H1MI67_9GAMM|nr:AMP-binding protein [Halopseudomonas xinjiangensis]SDR86055.1 long-chain acyl-CoA synthetase/feruloyl-CoA synthase [Halopseudomonas xinjiangensis]
MHIAELLALNARKYPNPEAIITASSRHTWSQLHDEALKLAGHLQTRCDIQPGDRVALFMPNGYPWVLGYFAVISLGAVVVPINARLTAGELEYILADCGARLLLSSASQQKELDQSDSLRRSLLMLDDPASLLAEEPNSFRAPTISPADPCTLLYTSGTTGKPKGVLFSHHNLLTVATSTAVEMGVRHESRLLHMMPLTHSAPVHVFLLGGTLTGASHVVLNEFRPDLLLDFVESERTTHFFGAPVAFLLTAAQPDVRKRDLSSMQAWIYGGAPLSTEQVRKVRDALDSDQLYCVYGLTEAGPSGTLMTPEEHRHKAGSIGRRGALHTEVRLVDEQQHHVADELVGEIQIRGEGMMLGYWNNPQATAECLTEEGWLFSGDLAWRDSDGYLWIVGRKKDLIISGGVNIYPREIEALLEQHPAIAEVAVIGAPHEQWGETVKACVVLREPVDNIEQALRDYLQPLLADYKMPRLYQQYPSLPRNANGKVMKHKLD